MPLPGAIQLILTSCAPSHQLRNKFEVGGGAQEKKRKNSKTEGGRER